MSDGPPSRRVAGDSPGGCGLPSDVAHDLDGAGFNLAGVLGVAEYDPMVPDGWQSARLLPGARSVVVLACGGRAFETALARAPERDDPSHPVDAFTERIVKSAARQLGAIGLEARALFYWQRIADEPGARGVDRKEAGHFADFSSLGEATGLGRPGRLRILLHPRFGPWMSIRALLLTTAELMPTPPLAGFAPCTGCPAPCAGACPAGVIASDGLDVAACFEARRRLEPCTTSCAARHACVIGPEHAYGVGAERHYMRSALTYYDD